MAVIGDTCFAMIKNLENEDGTPIEGLRENAVFWRCFLALLGDGQPWYPPKPQVERARGRPPCLPPPCLPLCPKRPRKNRSEDPMLAWIGLALLSISWLLGLGYYHAADWHAGR